MIIDLQNFAAISPEPRPLRYETYDAVRESVFIGSVTPPVLQAAFHTSSLDALLVYREECRVTARFRSRNTRYDIS